MKFILSILIAALTFGCAHAHFSEVTYENAAPNYQRTAVISYDLGLFKEDKSKLKAHEMVVEYCAPYTYEVISYAKHLEGGSTYVTTNRGVTVPMGGPDTYLDVGIKCCLPNTPCKSNQNAAR